MKEGVKKCEVVGDFLKGSKSFSRKAVRVKALFCAALVQCIIAGWIFLGTILDLYLGLLTVGFYFFGIGFYLLYHYLAGNFLEHINRIDTT